MLFGKTTILLAACHWRIVPTAPSFRIQGRNDLVVLGIEADSAVDAHQVRLLQSLLDLTRIKAFFGSRAGMTWWFLGLKRILP